LYANRNMTLYMTGRQEKIEFSRNVKLSMEKT
jgi:hypothetical protein